MAYAINLRCDNNTAEQLEHLWDRCSQLEEAPSMRAMGNPPHLTFAVYDELDQHILDAGFESALDSLTAMTIRFGSIGYFQAPHALILWAAPDLPPQISKAHTNIHATIDESLCRRNYRMGVWVPHCSLATTVPRSRMSDVLALVTAPFDPVEVVFDVMDYASFPPVEVIREVRLV